MGFSHAVVLAQAVHEHVLYSSGALRREFNILSMASPVVSSNFHLVYIDDLILAATSARLARALTRRCLLAYARAGLPDNPAKRECAGAVPNCVKAIGIMLDGAALTLSVPVDTRLQLLRATATCLTAPCVSGYDLSRLLGLWAWVALLRRPIFSVLQHSFRFAAWAQDRKFPLWPLARLELLLLMCLLPLLEVELRAPFASAALATDASQHGMGVCAASVTDALHDALLPLASSRSVTLLPHHLATREEGPPVGLSLSPEELAYLGARALALRPLLEPTGWQTIVSSAWRYQQHINILEMHAVLTGILHHLSRPDSQGTRLFSLVDSLVVFFCLWKGRCSSRRLLPVLRKVNACLLASGASLQPCWVPSAWNPADAPSRAPALRGPVIQSAFPLPGAASPPHDAAPQ
jgi:hypothetical protein